MQCLVIQSAAKDLPFIARVDEKSLLKKKERSGLTPIIMIKYLSTER